METLADTMFREIIPVYYSNPREGGYIELAIHGPLWAVQSHMGHSHIYTLTKTVANPSAACGTESRC
jgi:hypothetical protein